MWAVADWPLLASPMLTCAQVCKFFLDAVEKEVYGWFWTCPNGGDQCKYRHALPPGYVYKSKKQREAEAAAAADPENKVSIEEEIEELVCAA